MTNCLKGGGIGLIYKSNLKVKILDSGMGKTFENVVWQINLKNEKPVQLVGIYHPSPSKLHKHIITAFTNEFLGKYAEFGVKYNNIMMVISAYMWRMWPMGMLNNS